MSISLRLLPLFSLLLAFSVTGEDVLTTQLAAMQEQLNKLSQRVESQQKTIEQQQKVIETYQSAGKPLGTSPGAQLLDRMSFVERKADDAMKVASRKKPGDFNMAIAGAVDTSFRFYNGPNKHADGRAAGNDFQLRGAEFMFTADADPYYKAYVVMNAADDASNPSAEAAVSVEEAAIETSSLSHVRVKGGRFFAPFGRFAMIHDHDLPFVDRPASLDRFVGGESQGDGVMVSALLPVSNFWQINAGAFNKVGAAYAQRNGVNLNPDNPVNNRRSTAELTYFGKMLTSFDAGKNHTFELGLSTLQVPDRKIRRNLINLEFTYKWHPAGSELKERLVWGTELMRNQEALRTTRNYDFIYGVVDDTGAPVDADGDGVQDLANGTRPVFKRRSRTNFGGYSYVQYNLSRHWSLGARFDFNRDFGDYVPGQPTSAFGEDGQPWQAADGSIQPYVRRTSAGGYDSTVSAFVTYNFSEFSRLRFQANRHQYADRDFANEFLLQWTVFLGAHSHNFDQR